MNKDRKKSIEIHLLQQGKKNWFKRFSQKKVTLQTVKAEKAKKSPQYHNDGFFLSNVQPLKNNMGIHTLRKQKKKKY